MSETPFQPGEIFPEENLLAGITADELAAALGLPQKAVSPQVVGKDGAILPDLLCLAEVEARKVDWLWEPFIPARMLSMLSGDPGAGKSFIALAIAAELSRGRLLDKRTIKPENTLYLSVENPVAESVRPRFDALGGDPARFFLLQGTRFGVKGEEQRGAVTLQDLTILEKAIAQVCARLVIVDPIQSYFGAGVDLHRSNETRPIMDGLAKLAESHGCAFLLLRHLSKQSGGKAIHRGLGSIDLTGAVRCELLAGSLPDDPGARALVHTKSNVGPFGKTLGYAIDLEGRFSWTGESSITAAELLAAPVGNKLDEACQWLREQLGSGDSEEKKIRELAESEGISRATLRRAKDALKVRSRKAGLSGPWLWALPEDAHHSPEDVQGNCLSTFATIEHLGRSSEVRI